MKRFLLYAAAALALTAIVYLGLRTVHQDNSGLGLKTQPQPATVTNTSAIRPAVPSTLTSTPTTPSNGPVPLAARPASPRPARKRAWDTHWLAGLRGATAGDPLRFELVGKWAAGTIRHLEHAQGELLYVSGELAEPEAGRFFFQKQTLPGVAGDFVGVVELPASQLAFRIEPTGPGRAPELVEHPLGEVVCLRLPKPQRETTNQVEEIPPLKPGDFPAVPIPAYQKGIIVLESLPGSTPVIYLDFQGGYTPTWGGIAYTRPTVNNAQIRDVWVRVAEDYMPFNINVTTDLKIFQNAPENSRKRVVITPTDTAAPGAGGVAFVGSFNWTGDTPCWVFLTSGKSCAEACSHEAGHTVGLSHDGQDVNGVHTEYYDGQGSGDTGWAPIMGVGYDQNVSQWCKGEYPHANNTEDQLTIITTQNNHVGYRADDTGDTLATSRYLEVYSNFTVTAEGVIETTGDTDAFQFTTTGGLATLRAAPVNPGPDLALMVSLYDANDTLLLANNPVNTLYASLSTNLPAGTYTFRVTGTGRGKPLGTGFSPYASLGYYAIGGSVINARLPDRFSIPENTPNGAVVGLIPANNPDGDPLSFTISSGNTGGTFALDDSGTLSVADNSLLDYEALARNTQLPVQFEMFVDIVDSLDPAFTETNRRVVVAVTNVNEPPTSSGLAASVLEHSQLGTPVGAVTAADPDFYTLLSYSILDGNSNRMFAIDQSGLITVAGDLNAAEQSLYSLMVVISDQTPPVPLMATSTVTITVMSNATPFRPGTISYAVYTNIPGNLVSALTSSSKFPVDPALEKQMPTFEGDSNRGDSYGAVMRGYLMPPASGNYTFWIATDDNGELWLSGTTNPAAMTRIAYLSGDGNWAGPREWTKYASQQSAPISLAGGQAYYIEARMKEGSGNDNLAVAWECAGNGITQDVIPGKYLAPAPMNYVPHPTGFSISLHRDAILGSRLGTVEVSDVNSNDAETLTITGGNVDGIFSLDPKTGILRVTNEAALLATAQTTYSLQVRATDNGVPPRFGTANVTVTIVDSNAITATSLRQEIWTNIGNSTAVAALTGNAKFPRRPDALRPLSAFDSGNQNFGDNYGSRIRALLTPTNTGRYNFFIASDDNSQLKLSSSANPSNAVVIASVGGATSYQAWSTYASQRSAPVSLVAGQSYYLESVHKEGAGNDFVSVAWTGPGLAGTNVIAASFLTLIDLDFAPVLAPKTVAISLGATNGSIVTTLSASDSSLDTLTYKILSGNPGNTFAVNPDNGVVTVADNTLLATYAVSTFTLGIQVQDSGYGGLYPLKSSFACVTVQVIDDALPLVWTGNGNDPNWSTSNNWNGTLPAEDQKLSFDGAQWQTNHNDLLAKAGPVAINHGGFSIDGNPLILLAGISSSGDNTWSINSTLNRPQSFTDVSGTFVFAGNLDNQGYLLSLVANDTLRLQGVVSGSGGLNLSGPGRLILNAANSYTGPTVLNSGVLVLADTSSLAQSQSVEVQPAATLNASQAPGGFTVGAGQTLVNAGVCLGDIFIHGQLAAGESVGSLSFSNALVLGGQTSLRLSKTGPSLTNDWVIVGGTLTYGGSLLVTNLADPLALGDTFGLFQAAAFAGAFTNLSLPVLDASLRWDTSRLMTAGTLSVAASPIVPLRPVTVAGTNLVVEFPSVAGLSYVLEFAPTLQPPTVWTAISTNSGTGDLLSLTVPLDANQAQAFFRVRTH